MDVPGQSTANPSATLPVITRFDELALDANILRAIAESGYTTPTPIQAQAIVPVLQGRDVMGAAQTGTGKTAAFTLPVLHRMLPFASSSMSPARHPTRALVLTPTRELADQVADNVAKYGKHTMLRSAVVFGGIDIGPQKELLRKGVELLIATPGRLLDHVEQKTANLSQVNVLVLDEADRMLDMGFLPDLERILSLLPKQRQTLLFSATFSPEIRKLAHKFLTNPVEVSVAANNATASTISQVVYTMPAADKRAAVVHIVQSRNLNQVIVFTNSKIGTARLARQLERDGLRADAIHGDKTQSERMKALEAFKSGSLQVLVATDVAARGLDVAGVPCVINYDLPFNAEDYVHRIGRTGRAGASGDAIALVAPEDEKLLVEIERFTRKKIARQTLALPRAEAPQRTRNPEHETGRPLRRRHDEVGFDARDAVADTFFSKPYEPSSTYVPAPAAPTNLLPVKKPSVGLLLGGKKKS